MAIENKRREFDPDAMQVAQRKMFVLMQISIFAIICLDLALKLVIHFFELDDPHKIMSTACMTLEGQTSYYHKEGAL